MQDLIATAIQQINQALSEKVNKPYCVSVNDGVELAQVNNKGTNND